MEWDNKKQVGFHPVEPSGIYDRSYFDRFAEMSGTTVGMALNSTRVGLVGRHVGRSSVVDIGIGSGAFIELRGGFTYGYDVNPVATEWLQDKRLWYDPYNDKMLHATFWDSLEHIEHPEKIVASVREFCFVSIPIFSDQRDAETSKHFRPNEHFWYFTAAGLVAWFCEQGFACLEMNDIECSLGRESIGTFVFKRMP